MLALAFVGGVALKGAPLGQAAHHAVVSFVAAAVLSLSPLAPALGAEDVSLNLLLNDYTDSKQVIRGL